jgi:hypothetical protein
LVVGRREYRLMREESVERGHSRPTITCDEALKTAQVDAERAYRDLSSYRICVTLEHDGWHVDYELKNVATQGGGPHYVIDSVSGRIVTKRYEQ